MFISFKIIFQIYIHYFKLYYIIIDEKAKQEAEKHLKNHIESESFTILEALAASGLRSIRYAKEIPNLKQVTANDLEAEAVESIKRNIKYNELTEELVRPNQGDAMYSVLFSFLHLF